MQVVRVAGWLVFLGELSALACCWHLISLRDGRWLIYLGTLAAVLAWFHALPRCLDRWLVKIAAKVSPRGNHWQIGKYSEAEVRLLIEEATRNLPQRLRRLSVEIVDVRCAAAWTWLSILWPRASSRMPVILTSGSLYYLDRDELIAVLLHEIGHHLPQNRIGAPGGWPLADATCHAAAFTAGCLASSASEGVFVFYFLRWIALMVAGVAVGSTSRAIEHLSDLFAAERVGGVPMTNALLKLAEDEELSEVVLVRAARELIYETNFALEDVAQALADVRPYGRIFHANLFRHASEVSKKLRGDQRSHSERRKGGRENAELKAFVEKRRNRQLRRIRWRRFDADGDGALSAEEIAQLCAALVARPGDVLFTGREELEPTSHPPCRDRILLLHEMCPADRQGPSLEKREDSLAIV